MYRQYSRGTVTGMADKWETEFYGIHTSLITTCNGTFYETIRDKQTDRQTDSRWTIDLGAFGRAESPNWKLQSMAFDTGRPDTAGVPLMRQ